MKITFSVWEKRPRRPLGIRKNKKNEKDHEIEETPNGCLFAGEKVYKETLSYCSITEVLLDKRQASKCINQF
jgi:hypothetical protein